MASELMFYLPLLAVLIFPCEKCFLKKSKFITLSLNYCFFSYLFKLFLNISLLSVKLLNLIHWSISFYQLLNIADRSNHLT